MDRWRCASLLSPDEAQLSLIPLLPNNYSTLRIYLPKDDDNVTLDVIEDVYKSDFFPQDHENYLVHGTDNFVVSVLNEPIKGKENTHRGIITNKKGYDQIEVVVPSEDLGMPLVDRLEKSLKSMSFITEDIYHVSNENFKDDLMKVEEKHCQKKTAMKIGMIYCRNGQTSPQDMFSNVLGSDKSSQSFQSFVEFMGKEIDLEVWTGYMGDMKAGETGKAFHDFWKGIDVMYHVAPFLNAEGHRRLIGNDIAELFFLEEGEKTVLNPGEVGKLGTVPQVFAVVQPVGEFYRVGFFTNINIKPFGPNVPSRLLKPEEMKDLVLTKLHNGLVMCNSCPPMNRLFYVPRKETVDNLIIKYPKLRKHKKKLHTFMKPKPQPLDKKVDHKVIPEISFELLSEWVESKPVIVLEEETEQSKPIKDLHENLHLVLDSVLEILIEDKEKRHTFSNDILAVAKDLGGMKRMEKQIAILRSIGQASTKQIHAIRQIELPMLSIQNHIRTWNVHRYMPCLSLHTTALSSFIESERTYAAHLECIAYSYKKPFLKAVQLGNLTGINETKVHKMFFNIDELIKVSRRLLVRLEAQYSYFPLVFGVGQIVQQLKPYLESVFLSYFTNFQLMLDTWEEVMTENVVELLLGMQKESTFPDLPLSALLPIPIQHLGKYYKCLVNITCEMAGIDSKTLPKRPLQQTKSVQLSFSSFQKVNFTGLLQKSNSRRIPRGSINMFSSPTPEIRNSNKAAKNLTNNPTTNNTTNQTNNTNNPSFNLNLALNSSGSEISNQIQNGTCSGGCTAGNGPCLNCGHVKRQKSQGVIPKFIAKNSVMVQKSSPRPLGQSHTPTFPSRTKSENELSDVLSISSDSNPPTKELKRSLSKREKSMVSSSIGIAKKAIAMADNINRNTNFIETRNKQSPKRSPSEVERTRSATPIRPNPSPTNTGKSSNNSSMSDLFHNSNHNHQNLSSSNSKELLAKLHQAIHEKNSNKVTEVVRGHKNLVNVPDDTGKTPLHLASVEGPASIVKLLLKYGADTELRDEVGATPLHIAASSGQHEVVEFLLRNGSDVNSINNEGNTCLHMCARGKKMSTKPFQKIVDAYVKAGGNIHAKNKSGETIIHLAVSRGTTEMIQYILKKGGHDSLEVRDIHGHTPLHRAEAAGLIDFVTILSTACGPEESNPFVWEYNNHADSWNKYDDIAQKEIEKAFQTGQKEVVLAHGFFANANYTIYLRGLGGPMCQRNNVNGNIRTVRRINYAKESMKGNPTPTKKKDDTKEMLGKGMEDKKDDKAKKDSDLMTAIMTDNSQLLTQIIKNVNIDFNAPLPQIGESPLHLACSQGSLRIVKYLLKSNANLSNVQDITKGTTYSQWPIHNAAMNRHWTVVDYLLSKGHDPDAQNIDLNTCLHYVVRNTMTDDIRHTLDALFKAGANLDSKNTFGDTPLTIAIQRGGSVEMCQYLVRKGASLNISNKKGQTPLECAKSVQRHDLVAILESALVNPTTIKIENLYKPNLEAAELENQKTEEHISSEPIETTNQILLHEMNQLWTSSKIMKRMNKNLLHKMAARYVLNNIKDQLIPFKGELIDGLPSSLIAEGRFSIKRQAYIYYLFDSTLILGTPSKTQKRVVVVKSVISLRSIVAEPELSINEEEGIMIKILYTLTTSTKPEVLEITTPDDTFHMALHEQLQENVNLSSNDGDSVDWIEELNLELNLIPRLGICEGSIHESVHEDEAYSETEHEDKI